MAAAFERCWRGRRPRRGAPAPPCAPRPAPLTSSPLLLPPTSLQCQNCIDGSTYASAACTIIADRVCTAVSWGGGWVCARCSWICGRRRLPALRFSWAPPSAGLTALTAWPPSSLACALQTAQHADGLLAVQWCSVAEIARAASISRLRAPPPPTEAALMYVPFSFSRFAPFVLVFGLLFHPRWCMHFTPPLDLLHTANCRTQCTTCTADSTYETTACTTSTNRVCSPVRSPCPLLPCPLLF